jgi:hypothetical protein
METLVLLDVLLRSLLLWWHSRTSGESSTEAQQQPCSNTSSSCYPSLDRCSRKRGSRNSRKIIHVPIKHYDVCRTGISSSKPSNLSLLQALLTPNSAAPVRSQSITSFPIRVSALLKGLISRD